MVAAFFSHSYFRPGQQTCQLFLSVPASSLSAATTLTSSSVADLISPIRRFGRNLWNNCDNFAAAKRYWFSFLYLQLRRWIKPSNEVAEWQL